MPCLAREQLVYAAKTDAEDLAREVLPKVGDDVNKKDGLGMTGEPDFPVDFDLTVLNYLPQPYIMREFVTWTNT